MFSITFTRKELEDFALNVLGIRRTAMRRISTLILAQLLKMKMNGQAAAYEIVEDLHCLEDYFGQAARLTYMRSTVGPRCLDVSVVFKRVYGSNYYLTLAKKKDRQQYIHQRLNDACRYDFPFLEDIRQPIHYSKQYFQDDPGPLLTAA